MALNTVLTSTGGFPNAIAIYYDKLLLDRLEKQLFLDQFGDQKTLPKNVGNEIKWTRYTNFAVNTTPLTEGTVPNGLTLASTQISAIPVQYGDYVSLSDRLIMEAIDPVIKGAADVLSYRAALSLDTIVRIALTANVTNQFAGAAADEINTSAVVNAAEIRQAVFTLKNADVRPFPDGFASVVHPATSFDLQSDTATGGWLDINKYTTTGPAYKGELGRMYGTRFVESSNMLLGTGAASAVTYHNFIFGKGAYGTVSLAGGNMKMIAKQLGSSGVSDPLDQIATIGYKFFYVTLVLDANRAIELIGTSAAV